MRHRITRWLRGLCDRTIASQNAEIGRLEAALAETKQRADQLTAERDEAALDAAEARATIAQLTHDLDRVTREREAIESQNRLLAMIHEADVAFRAQELAARVRARVEHEHAASALKQDDVD